MTLNVAQCLRRAGELKTVADSWRLDTELLLAMVLHCRREKLLTWPEQSLSAEQEEDFQRGFARRLQGEPLAYITGHREFWNLDLVVDRRVLIPRPETELLVEIAPQLLAESPRPLIADLGTGSGAIALALSRELPNAEIWAVDASADALDVARSNARRLAIDNISLLQASWCEGFTDQRFDLIVSNPPYIAEGDPHLQRSDLRFEPRHALTSGPDGLDAIRTICLQARKFLRSDSWLLLEHGYQQRDAVAGILTLQGYIDICCWQDLSGLDRVSGGRVA
ncbi:MAG: peptide chain release factor N(5)-glutamine methyltransferase [Pseudohongiellaceae bacterium]